MEKGGRFIENNVGRKIKELRMAMKMTQTELAEPEMTKGMLSHIENGHANPSMKNLNHIAKKLNKPIGYFFVEEGKEEKESEKDGLDRVGNIEKVIEELQEKNISVDSDLLYIEGSKYYMKLVANKIKQYKYRECIELLKEAETLYEKSGNEDVFLEIRMLALQPSIYYAMGDFDKCKDICDMALKLSKERDVYYLIDDIYRIKAVNNMIKMEEEEFHYNMDRAQKYVDFTEKKLNKIKLAHIYAKYENNNKNPLKALEHLKIYEENPKDKSWYYHLEKGKSEYLSGNYYEALGELSKIDDKKEIGHMIDVIYKLTGKLYKGLALCKIDLHDKGIKEIGDSIEEIEAYVNNEYLGFVKYACYELVIAYDMYGKLLHDIGRPQEAYESLEKSMKYEKKMRE